MHGSHELLQLLHQAIKKLLLDLCGVDLDTRQVVDQRKHNMSISMPGYSQNNDHQIQLVYGSFNQELTMDHGQIEFQ